MAPRARVERQANILGRSIAAQYYAGALFLLRERAKWNEAGKEQSEAGERKQGQPEGDTVCARTEAGERHGTSLLFPILKDTQIVETKFRQEPSIDRRGAFAMIASQALPGEVERAAEKVVRDFVRREGLGRVCADFTGKGTHRFRFITDAGKQLAGEIGPAVENLPIGSDVAVWIVGEREVCEEEPLRVQLGNSVERSVPEFERDVGRRRSRADERMALDGNARGVAHKGDALRRVEVGDVMRRVAWSVKDLKRPRAEAKDLAAFEGMEIRLRHGEKLPIETLHLVAIKPRSAVEKLGRVGHMRRAARMNKNLQSRILLNQ